MKRYYIDSWGKMAEDKAGAWIKHSDFELALASERTRREEAEKVVDKAVSLQHGSHDGAWATAVQYRTKYPRDTK
jgi:hypothetical protein